MQIPNEFGVYSAESVEELARHGNAYAAASFCQCEDGLVRFAIEYRYSTGGYGGPISAQDAGYSTISAARDAARAKLLQRLHTPYPSEADSVKAELRGLRAGIEAAHRQPTLF